MGRIYAIDITVDAVLALLTDDMSEERAQATIDTAVANGAAVSATAYVFHNSDGTFDVVIKDVTTPVARQTGYRKSDRVLSNVTTDQLVVILRNNFSLSVNEGFRALAALNEFGYWGNEYGSVTTEISSGDRSRTQFTVRIYRRTAREETTEEIY